MVPTLTKQTRPGELEEELEATSLWMGVNMIRPTVDNSLSGCEALYQTEPKLPVLPGFHIQIQMFETAAEGSCTLRHKLFQK